MRSGVCSSKITVALSSALVMAIDYSSRADHVRASFQNLMLHPSVALHEGELLGEGDVGFDFALS